MKKHILFFCIIFVQQVVFGQFNHSYGPEFEQNWRTYPGMEGFEHFVGVNANGPIVEYVCFVNWQWNEGDITKLLTVESVELRFRAEYGDNEIKTFNFTLHSVENNWESTDFSYYHNQIIHNDNRKLFEDNIQSNSNGIALYDGTITDSNLLNYIKTAIQNGNEFTLALRSEDGEAPWWELFSYDGTSGWYGPSIELTINYSTIPQNYQFVNDIESTENYGTIVLKNTSTSIENVINSGADIDLDPSILYSVRTGELPYIVDWNGTGKAEKHNNWIVSTSSNYTLNYELEPDIDVTGSKLASKFIETKQASINSSIEGEESIAIVKLKDPWYYYESGGEWNHTNVYYEYVTPKTFYNNSLDQYGGVFLDQTPDPNDPAKPYYKVNAPQQTININGSDHQMYFLNWEASNATLQDANSEKTGVVFHSDNAVVTANYKCSLLSSTDAALRGPSQRKIARTSDGSYHIVYESMGRAWYETKPL